MAQQFWQKLNANERMATTGAIIVFIAGLVGGGWLSVVGSAVVVILYWLKYSPNQSINWPFPIQLINLVISAILAILALIGLLAVLGLSGFGLAFAGFFAGFFLLYALAGIAVAVGAVMMALGTWREYQAMPKSTPPPPPG
jgi:hypothetical protein